MRIYFGASIRGGRDDVDLYRQIIEYLKERYGEVLTEHIGYKDLSSNGEISLSDREIYQRDMAWLSTADVVIAEVTQPSLGVGFELGQALSRQKPTLCLHRTTANKKLSAMIAGAFQITNREYTTLNDAKRAIDEFFEQLA